MRAKFKGLTMGILLAGAIALIAGPAAAALIVDGDFNASVDSAALRDNGAGQDWYESKETNPARVILHDGTSSPIFGNNTNMARLYNNAETSVGSAYLTQDFETPQTGIFSISFDIAIDSIYNRSSSSATDSTGFIYVGEGIGSQDGPNSTGTERFVYLGFYDSGGGTTGQGINMMANNNAVEVTNPNTLSYDTWYTITLGIDVVNGEYSVTVDDTYGTGTYIQTTGIPRYSDVDLESLSFFINGPNDQFGSGEYYVDNVSAVPIPGAALLLGSGLIGLGALRRRRADK